MRAAGAIVPHAPLLLPHLTSAETLESSRRLLDAVSRVDLGRPDLLVIVSSHGRSSGVYRRPAGTLADLGVPEVAVEAETDASGVDALARLWGVNVLDEPADHGVVVPLLAGVAAGVPVLAATLGDLSAPDAFEAERCWHDSSTLAAAISSLARSRSLAIVASGHTSAALSPRAPLTELPGAKQVEEEAVGALATDVGALASIGPRLLATGGACGAGVLVAFGKVFEGSRARVLARESPVGVGYLVAEIVPST